MLSLKFLGTPLVELNQQPIGQFRSAKSLALLAYLAIERKTHHHRTHLITLLWSDLSEQNGRQNLSQTITRLRNTLGSASHIIRATRNEVWLDDNAEIEIDVQTFRQLLQRTEKHQHKSKTNCVQCQADLAHAVSLVRGNLLAGLTINNSIVFDEWLVLTQEQMYQMLLGALTDLTNSALHNRKYETAIQYARQHIALEAWSESAHRQLIEALALSGQRNAALLQYEQCRAILQQELGVEPMQVTQQLANAVREGKFLAAPPSTAATTIPNNLQHHLTPFIGREAEIATILTAFSNQNGARLLTIVGAGGMGKTRLAQEVGSALLATPPPDWALEGVWFVPLIGVNDAQNVPITIANTLGLSLPNQEPASDAVIQQLRSRNLLLILDNFETLLESRTWLLNLLQAAAGVRLLVTSREPLRLLAEQRVKLNGLAVPPADSAHTHALNYDASRLFLDRARRLFSNFRLTAENWQAITQICRLMEGLPLGIELTVTLLDAHTPAEVAAQIMADAATVTSDCLDIAPHQRSLQLVFEQSWVHLSTQEQRILSQLSIFESDRFDAVAARYVAGAQPQHLNALVRKSLVQAYSDNGYALHPLHKIFAARKLPQDQSELRNNHANYFTQFFAEAVPAVFNKQKHLQLHALLPLLPDLRACWQWRISTANAELIIALAGPVYRLLRETAQLEEGRAWFEDAHQKLSEAWQTEPHTVLQQTALAYLSAHLGFFRLFCGDPHGARPVLEYALAEFNRLRISEGRGATLAALSDTLGLLGMYATRLALWQQELVTAELSNDPLELNRVLGNWGESLYHMGQLETARAVFLRTLETAPANVPDYDIAITINNLGLTELALGNLKQARKWLEQSLQIRLQYSNTYRIASARQSLGLLALTEFDFTSARQQFEQALTLYEKSGRRSGLATVHLGLAQTALRQKNWASASQHIQKALTYAQKLKSVALGLEVLLRWGEYLWRVGQIQPAQTLLGYVLEHPNTSGFLKREINIFLTANQITLPQAVSPSTVDWTWWLANLPQ